MKNQKYGVGGFAPIIIVNMTETLVGILVKSSLEALMIPLAISFVMVIIMIFMEMHEKRIPVQRVSVHNVHAEKNYMAIKYNPVGFMALMFGSAIFMIPQLIVALKFKDENPILLTSDNGLQVKAKGLKITTITLKEFLKR